MHSPLQRLNQVFMFSVTLFACQGFVANILALLEPENPEVAVSFRNINLVRSKFNTDQANIEFDLSADLSTVFNWNTKQLFIMVVAEYQTTQNVRNEVVVWDHIIPSKEDAKFTRTGLKPEYHLRDLGFGLRSNNVTLLLKWNYMPNSGLLTYNSLGKDIRTFPESY
eukprot:c16004_g1_i1.p1 GENE.c16004_g1_i1~~c16004_g1_i1.p1  ORF type:complete len:182 (+),score=26.89 c16004_g1_i1:47-547(+)